MVRFTKAGRPLCEICQKKKATSIRSEKVEGGYWRKYYCDKCYKKKKYMEGIIKW